MKLIETDVLIIGAGPAGLSAAIAAAKEGASVILIERDNRLGGILNQCIHNGFGLHTFKEELTGPEYASRFVSELKKYDGITIKLNTMVIRVDADKTVVAVSRSEGIIEYKAKTIIFAMGCRERSRGALSISGTRPSGVMSAGLAQRLVNMEGLMCSKKVVILGSGDIGLIMARRMTWQGAKVEAVCELMPFSSGLTRNIVQCLDDNNIPLLYNTTVIEVHGRKRLEGITIATVDSSLNPILNTARYIECDTLLLSVGLIPENELAVPLKLSMDSITNGAIVDQNRETDKLGFFACGNVLHVHDLADNVSVEGDIAGRCAALRALDRLPQPKLTYAVGVKGAARYALPHRISDSSNGNIDIYYRVGKVVNKAVVRLECGSEVLLSKKHPILLPGEMQKITVSADKIRADVVLSVDNS